MQSILHIAVPCPLRQTFDYLSDEPVEHWQAGMRVNISFAHRLCIGVVMGVSAIKPTDDITTLKKIEQRLDDLPLLPDELMQTIQWTSQYYHHPLGDCFQTALPKLLRKGTEAELEQETWWQKIPNADTNTAALGEKQRSCLTLLDKYPEGLSQTTLKNELGTILPSLKSLQKKGYLCSETRPRLPVSVQNRSALHRLNDEQQHAIEQIAQSTGRFTPFLLQGITGSGKTEVYISLTKHMLEQGKQTLVLIPEIGLTGEFVNRFKQHLDANIVVMHSSVADSERKQAWLLAKAGLADVIIGTRSAVFTPLAHPGLIIIDEEHDSSYKQQDGLRYHARNVALIRAQKMQLPIVMGSATPSLESLYQIEQQRYQLLTLNQRAGGASLPKVKLINSVGANPDHGLSLVLIEAIKTHLNEGNQVILFINRRGFAPVLMCHDCGWQAQCSYCDARMVVHQHRHVLFCHHCGYIQHLVERCPNCDSTALKSYGAGTEKIEQSLQNLFPQTPVLRIDRDTTQRVNAFTDLVAELKRGEPRILVGTQMLAKGHDFHDVTLVGVLDTDQGLYSADFKATESLAQLITQVTGRAGRGEKRGEVLIQTEQPDHPFWQQLLKQGYNALAQQLLLERKETGLPPVTNWAVIRAEAQSRELANQFLEAIAAQLNQAAHPQVMLLGPVPSIMEKKAGRFRAQLLLTSPQRKPIHQVLDYHISAIERHKLARKVRWSIDIDPVDLL